MMYYLHAKLNYIRSKAPVMHIECLKQHFPLLEKYQIYKNNMMVRNERICKKLIGTYLLPRLNFLLWAQCQMGEKISKT